MCNGTKLTAEFAKEPKCIILNKFVEIIKIFSRHLRLFPKSPPDLHRTAAECISLTADRYVQKIR